MGPVIPRPGIIVAMFLTTLKFCQIIDEIAIAFKGKFTNENEHQLV